MIYVASPYSSENKQLEELRFVQVRFFTAKLLQANVIVFSPIVYGYEIAKAFEMKTDAVTWTKFNNDMLRHCDHMMVLKLPGWEQSKGVQAEISLANILNIPITYAEFINENN